MNIKESIISFLNASSGDNLGIIFAIILIFTLSGFLLGMICIMINSSGNLKELKEEVNEQLVLPLLDALWLATTKERDYKEGRLVLGNILSLPKEKIAALEKLNPEIMKQFAIAEANYDKLPQKTEKEE